MTVEEVFGKLVARMREGVQFHRDMADAYDFIGLYGFAREQNKHMIEEMKGCRKLAHYYLTHYHKLIMVAPIEIHNIIPETWYKYMTIDVDVNTKQKSVKDLMGKWIEWEKSQKKLYEEMYIELTNMREIAAASQVLKYVRDVDEELADAQKVLIEIEGTNYDMTYITELQNK